MNLSSCAIKGVAQQITQLSRGTELSHNSISRLPKTFSNLAQLKKLSMWKNRVTEIGPEITQLPSLEKLGLQSNFIKKLPLSLAKLVNLKLCDLECNSISFPPAQVCNQGRKAIFTFLTDVRQLGQAGPCSSSAETLVISSVRSHSQFLESPCKMLVEADLLILPFLPSKSEDFGLLALQAISADLPILVSRSSGLAEALTEVLYGRLCVVDSDKPEVWSDRIMAVKEKRRSLRLSEARTMREKYDEKYSWEAQCKAFWDRIMQLL